MEITRSHIEFAKSDQTDIWSFGNEILYRLCREYPSHQKRDIVVAKIWLIGRSYAAAVERGKKDKDGEASLSKVNALYEQVAIIMINSELDERIDALRQYGTIDDGIIQILELHRYLVILLGRLTKDNKRSLASKYLHFHLPNLFYLYDSVAIQSLTDIKRNQRAKRKVSGDFDNDYKSFFLRLLDLRDEIQQRFGEELTPRQIDRILWNLSNQ